MRALGLVAAALVLLALVAYAAGLGIYAVAATRPRVSTQPRTQDEARSAIERLGLAREYPFAHRFALLPHGRMHYIDEGEGPILLCLHGNGSWSLECADLVKARTGGARVIAPDLIGFGLSEKPAHPDANAIEAHAEDLAALVEALGLEDVQIAVADTSAPIGIQLARLAPERVRSSVLREQPTRESELRTKLARVPLLGELLVQGLGAASPGFAHGPLGRAQGSWDERASSLALARSE
jgi:pimeloyl-ACP methyl ester carboxylesterase